MPAVRIPDLKRKFTLLRTHPTPRTWPELAAAFGRPYKTLQTWQDGKAESRAPDRMADWAVPIFTRLIGAILPGERTADEVRQFVFGPAALLEEEVRSGAAVSLLELLDREARRDTATLIRKNDPSIELVEVETEDRSPCPRVALDEFFRIAIRRRLPFGYLLALQHTQRAWALLVEPSVTDPGVIWVPGAKGNGQPSFMRERRDPGRHLFVCVETSIPAPASLRAASRDEIGLDKRSLDALAAFYLGQPATQRACHILAVDIEAAARPPA